MSTVQPFRLTGWHVLACMTAFFAVDIAINVGFIVRAVQTFPGEVADDPYEAGVAYDHTLAREAAERRLGWQATVGEAAALGGGEAITAHWSDKAGQPLDGLTVTGVLRRPATEQDNITVRFVAIGPGAYRAVAKTSPGAWDLELTAADGRGRQRTAERRQVWR